jgi:Na/Pi-cotransporter
VSVVHTVSSIVAAIVLFLYGLEGFSRELQHVGEGTFQRVTSTVTRTRWRGFAVGAGLTALIQSSSAVSSITVALVDSGAITFRNSLGVLIGANVGTTSTAWLVSFKLTGIGPIFIVLGTLIGLVPHKARVFGKAVFYFGFVLFALDLVSASLAPIREAPLLKQWLGASSSLALAAVIGMVITAIVQSSSVTSGLAILLVQQRAIAPEAAIAVVVGANAGTTVTSLLASAKMKLSAKRAARANLLFNLTGVLVLLPFLGPFAALVVDLGNAPSTAVALAHLLFNVGIALPFLLLLKPFERLLLRLWPEPRPPEAAHVEGGPEG